MKRINFLLLLLLLSSIIMAQTRPVKGTIRDSKTGNPLPSVTIKVSGKNISAISGVDGAFSVNIPSGSATLEISSVGYTAKTVGVGANASTVEITMDATSAALTDVVVTALGINRSAKSLVYANQVVSGHELTDVKTDNLMNSLNGKVAGVNISPSSSGVGGSVKVILRGNKNAFGTNQPLYVVDGMPITNSANANIPNGANPGLPNTSPGQPNGTFGGTPDGGDGISNLNPDDIESMTVLEGASAAALYGSQAANGVILITTKKGKAGKALINFSSSYTNDVISYKPKFQNSYGVVTNGNQSWGPALATPATHDNLSDFFVHGQNVTNSINFSAGSELAQTYFSYANTYAAGVQPTNKLKRNNFTFREVAHLLNNKLTVDVNTSYINQKVNNTPGQGLYYNTLTGLYLFPRGTDILPYKNNYGIPDASRNGLLKQNWIANEDVQQNPWWILYKNPNYSTRNRFLINASIKYDFADWLSIQARGNVDRVADIFEQDLYAGTNPVLSKPNGQYTRNDQTFTQTYGDFLVNFKVPMRSLFKIDGVVGTSITNGNTVGTYLGAGNGLSIPNIFIQQNVSITSQTSNAVTLPSFHNQIQSIFGSANFSYDEWIYLVVTGRNDWSSNLAYTTKDHYFYPSVGLSFILSDKLHLPDFITYAKVRGSYAEVATTVTQYISNPINYSAPGGSVLINPIYPVTGLKPTNTKSTEAGTDLRFLKDRLSLNFTWYKSNTYNQLIQYVPNPASGYPIGYLNAGNIQNTGIELRLGYDVLKGSNFTWNSSVNLSSNKNKVIQLNPDAPTAAVVLTSAQPNAFQSAMVAGGSFADIWGFTFERNTAGQIKLNDKNAPISSSILKKVGNPNPKFQMGWNNTFTYRNFNLSVLVDGKFGGQVMSMTQMMMDSYGTSKASGDARANGGVKVNAVDINGKAVTTVDAMTWYSSVGGRTGIAEPYLYSATAVRLRQLMLGYLLPIRPNYVKSIKVSLIANNLFYISKKAPYDPEVAMSTANGLSGVDVFNQPTTRRVGAQLNISF